MIIRSGDVEACAAVPLSVAGGIIIWGFCHRMGRDGTPCMNIGGSVDGRNLGNECGQIPLPNQHNRWILSVKDNVSRRRIQTTLVVRNPIEPATIRFVQQKYNCLTAQRGVI